MTETCICPGCGRTGTRAEFTAPGGGPACPCGYEVEAEHWPTVAEMAAHPGEWSSVRLDLFLPALLGAIGGKKWPEK